MSVWPDWLKLIQLKARYLFGLWLLGALVLLLPESIAAPLHLVEIRDSHGGLIGLATLASFAFWVVALVPFFEKRIQARKRREEAVGAIVRALDSLSPEEYMLLTYCVTRNQRTILLPFSTAEANTAAGLRQKRLIVVAGGFQNRYALPHTIPDLVWEQLLYRVADFLLPEEQQKRGHRAYFERMDKMTSGRMGVGEIHRMLLNNR